MLIKGLKSRLLLSVFLIIITFGAAISYYVYLRISIHVLEDKISEMELIMIEKSDRIDSMMDFGLQFVTSVAELDGVQTFLENQESMAPEDIADSFLLRDIANQFSAIYLMDADGLTLASTDERFIGNNYGFRTYFASAINGDVGADIARGVTSGEVGIYFSSPVYAETGELLGVIVAKMNPKNLEQAMSITPELEGRDLLFVDNFGIVAYAKNPYFSLKALTDLSEDELEVIQAGRYYEGVDVISLGLDNGDEVLSWQTQGFYEDTIDNSGQEYTVLSNPIRNTEFHLLVLETKELYLKDARHLALLMSLAILFAAISALLTISLIITKSLSPLETFQKAAKRISKADFSHPIRVKGVTEFEMLAQTFNTMMHSLKLKKEDLQAQIDDQTEQLEEQKDDLEERQAAMVNILEDVADEKAKTEQTAQDLQKFKMAVDGASDHIVLTDPEGIIVYANPSVERITGFSQEEVLGKKVGSKELWGGLMDKPFYKKLWKIIKVDKKSFSGELKNKRKSGEIYDAAATVTPILNGDNEVIFFLGIERDVTMEKNIDRAKTEFVSLASHQLRTPLTAIRWYIDLLLDGDAGKVSKQQSEYLQTIKESNVRMVNLVNSLLNVSRLELGTFSVDPQPTDFVELIHQEVQELTLAMQKKHLNLSEHLEDLGLIPLDQNLTGIIIQNILSNAVKYTGEGGAIEVRLFEGTAKGKESNRATHAIFSVKDSGAGIPLNQQSRIFEKMFRADNAQTIDPEGNGLGLYMVKRIVEETGGEIWFESKEGEGTTFYISIPKKGMKKREGTKRLTSDIEKANGKKEA